MNIWCEILIDIRQFVRRSCLHRYACIKMYHEVLLLPLSLCRIALITAVFFAEHNWHS
jgi:hypothetical protein